MNTPLISQHNGRRRGLHSKAKRGFIFAVLKLSGSAAEKAGFLTGDRLVSIDKITIDELENFENVIEKIRGDVGTTTCIEILRGKVKKNLCAERTASSFPRFRIYIVKNLGIIEIRLLDKNFVAKDFAEALATIEAKGIKNLVIDFRFNENADLLSGQEFMSQLLPNETALFRIKYLKKTETYSTKNNRKEKRPFEKIIVLQAQSSSGMTEQITRLLKEKYENTIIMGEESGGDALVKSLVPVEKNFSLLIPVAEIVGLNGEKYHGVPIQPDIKISAIMELNLELFEVFFPTEKK